MIVTIIFTVAIAALVAYFFTTRTDQKQEKEKIEQTNILSYSDLKNACPPEKQPPKEVKKPAKSAKNKINNQKSKNVDTFKHQNLITNLKSHTDRISSISASQNEKVVAITSDDRTLTIWPSKNFGKGNSHQKLTIEMDRSIDVGLSPDGKLVAVALDFGNTVRLYKVNPNEASPKDSDFKTLPVNDENLLLKKMLLGYNCKKRNTVKEQKLPFLVTLNAHATNAKKPWIYVTDHNGNNLQNSPIDPALGLSIKALKLSSTKNYFGVAGEASNFKIFQVPDDRSEVKKITSISCDSAVLNFSFNATDKLDDGFGKKLLLGFANGFKVYQLSEEFEWSTSLAACKLLKEVALPEKLVNSSKKFTEAQFVAMNYPQVYVTNSNLTSVCVFDLEKSEIVEEYESISTTTITGLEVLPTRKELLVSCGKVTRVLKI